MTEFGFRKGWVVSTRTGFDSRPAQFQIMCFSKYIVLLQCSGLFLATINISETKAIHLQCKTSNKQNLFPRIGAHFLCLLTVQTQASLPSLLHRKEFNLFLARMLSLPDSPARAGILALTIVGQ